MAKFAVALCILLVACGTQGAENRDISDNIASWFDWFVEKFKEKEHELAEGMAEMIRHSVDFEQKIEEKTDQILDEWKQEILEYSDSAENLNWCVSRKSKFEKEVKKVKSNGLKCVTDRRDHLSQSYDLTVAAFEELKGDVNEIKEQAGECSGWFDWGCLGDIWDIVSNDLTPDMNTLLGDATALTGEFIGYVNTLEACGFNDALETLPQEKEKASAEIKKCLVNLECATD